MVFGDASLSLMQWPTLALTPQSCRLMKVTSELVVLALALRAPEPSV